MLGPVEGVSMNKTRVVVLMGGTSLEHEVSLRSGAKIAENLDPDRYTVTPVVIGKDGRWAFPDAAAVPLHEALVRLVTLAPDCVFPALHGPFGEDGRLQGALDLLGLAYVGSGCIASGVAIDKVRAKALVEHAGMRVPRQVVVGRQAWDADADRQLRLVEAATGFPCVMKSPCQGSSLGMAMPRDAAEFTAHAGELFALDDVILVEEYLRGTEVTCSILDVEPGAAPTPLAVTEIAPVDSTFFDYTAKYTPGACEEVTPARIPEEQARRVETLAVLAHTTIGCAGLSRSDFIIVDDEPVWLEVNTIPGMTDTSLAPQAARYAGIGYAELVAMLVDASARPPASHSS
jgi:D-alanine-D-alanine ligase